MVDKQERVAYPLTFLLKKEGNVWASLACELDVASCGDSLDEAREMLKEAVALYVTDLVESGELDKVARPIPKEALVEFATDPPGELHVEYHTLLVYLKSVPPTLEFLPSMVRPADCQPAVAAA
jgi:predicted RNase H-like HicB family nuclease